MSAQRSHTSDGTLESRQSTSLTQRLARASALNPWRVVAAWGLILLPPSWPSGP